MLQGVPGRQKINYIDESGEGTAIATNCSSAQNKAQEQVTSELNVAPVYPCC